MNFTVACLPCSSRYYDLLLVLCAMNEKLRNAMINLAIKSTSSGTSLAQKEHRITAALSFAVQTGGCYDQLLDFNGNVYFWGVGIHRHRAMMSKVILLVGIIILIR